ncbi:GPN-loop GTPase [Haematococcus lacustris]
MGKYAQLVIGPAGCGKSTYCDTLYQHCQAIGRTIHIVNLDPAAEHFAYPVSLDVRDLVTLEDVMEEMELGPNGGLLYCMEYLEDNLHEWLGEELQGYGDDDYLMFDCPGQIELYSHLSIFKTFVDFLRNDGWSVCAVYCLDAHFVTDVSKFIAGALQALSAMVKLELPHVNILTKMDICESKAEIEDFLFPEPRLLLDRLSTTTGPRFAALNSAVGALLDEFSLVSFVPLDVTDEDSIAEVLYNIDTAIQYGEDAEVKVREQEGIEGMEGEAEAALS